MNISLAEHLKDPDNFRGWLKNELAKSSDVGYTRIDFSMSLSEIGISSIHVVRLAGELEKLLELELEPSLLQEFDTIEDMARTLLRMREGRQARASDRGVGLPVAIAASFTAEPIEPSLVHLLGALGLDPRVSFAAYHQVFQELLNERSLLSQNTGGINVVLLRIEDWFRYASEPPPAEQVERAVDDLLSALSAFAARCPAPLVVALAPHSPHTVRRLGLGERLAAIDARILEAVGALATGVALDLRRVDEVYRVPRVWDEARDRLGHLPYTQAAYAALGAATARRIARLRFPTLKVIALDCDNTLWGGVAGDVGPDGVELGEAHLALQRFMVAQSDAGTPVDDRLQFSTDKVDFSEAYYVLWNDPRLGLSMVVRYVLHNGVLEETRMAEVWCGFRDRRHPDRQIAIRQRYPIGRAEIHNRPELRLTLGPSGFSDDRVWGVVAAEEGEVRWDLRLDRSQGVTVDRIPEADRYALLPRFQSNGARHHLSGEVIVNGHRYALDGQLASDGHYWNTRHLRGWAWARCAAFEGDPDFVVEGIGTRFNDHAQTSTWITILWRGQRVTSSLVDAIYFNRELDSGLNAWGFSVERGDLRFIGRVRAPAEDMNLQVHPLPDDEYLYTHISYSADMEVDIERKEGGRWWKVDSRVARGTAAFEVTRKTRNPEVRREFRVVKTR